MHRLAHVIVVTLFLLTIVTARADENMRAWRKDDSNSPSFFVPMGQKQWVEAHLDGTKIPFTETRADKNQIELFDGGRRRLAQWNDG